MNTVLGHEFDNVILLGDVIHKYDVNSTNGDVSNARLITAISRTRSQLHLITFSGKEMNRWWDWYQQCMRMNYMIDQSIKYLTDHENDFYSFLYEVLGWQLRPPTCSA